MLAGVSDNEGMCVLVSVCVCVISLPVFQVEFWRLVLSFKLMGRPSLAQAKREGPHPSMQYHKVGGSPRLRRDVIANTSCIGMKFGRRLFQIFEPNSPRKKYKKKTFWLDVHDCTNPPIRFYPKEVFCSARVSRDVTIWEGIGATYQPRSNTVVA
jgi:hypothetical protein